MAFMKRKIYNKLLELQSLDHNIPTFSPLITKFKE